MKIIDRYVLKQMIVGFVLVLVSMTVLVWLTQSLRMIDMIVTKGVSVGVFLKLTVLVLPNFLQILSPLALFAVSLFTLIRMQSDKEVMVMQAVGMSPFQIMRPIFQMAAVLTILGYLFSVFIIPASNTALREMRWNIKNDLSHLLLQEGQFNSFKNGLTLYVRERLPDGTVEGILAYEAQEGKKNRSVLSAKTGTLFQEPDGVRVVFYDGTRQEYVPGSERFSILKFDKYTMAIADKNENAGQRNTDVRELSLGKLLTAKQSEFKRPAQWRKHKVEFVKRLVTPLYNFTFVFLAMFGILCGYYNRRGQMGRINMTVMAALAIQSLSLAFENMAGKNLWFLIFVVLNVFVPVWLIYVFGVQKKKIRLKWLKINVFLIGILFAVSAGAVPKLNLDGFSSEKPVDFEADKVTYLQSGGELEAKGNVVLMQNGTTLETEKIIYNQKKNQIFVPDDIVIKMPDGSVIHTENATLSGGMESMNMGKMEAVFYEGTRLNAEKAYQTDSGQQTYMKEATYTPCDVCEGKSPLWQLRSKTIQHDKMDKEIAYKHVFLDVKDVPVFYFPYFKMPDFSVKRKTGFLTPRFGGGREMKSSIELPFFVDIADNQNLLITPTISPTHFPLIQTNYEGVFDKGMLTVNLSGTKNKDDEKKQGHIQAAFEYSLTDKWRIKGDLFRVSSDTYFRRYRLPDIDDSQSFLTSGLALERFGNRNYFGLKGYSFQSLQDGVSSDSIPVILPVMNFRYTTRPTSWGLSGFTEVNSALFNTREDFKSNRLSLTQGVHVPYISQTGVAVDMRAFVRADGYAVDTGKNVLGIYAENDAYNTGRLYANASATFSYPLSRRGKNTMQVLEPVVMVVAAPNGGNDDKIPNVDSLVFDFDDTNLFSANRFSGYDRVEPGTRVNYGVRWSLFNTDKKQSVSALFGQSYRLDDDEIMTELMGYNNNFSDYVGRVQYIHDWLELNYKFRLNQKDFSPKKTEVSAYVGHNPLRFGVSYVKTPAYRLSEERYGKREEIVVRAFSHLTRDFKLSGYYRYDLGEGGGPVDTGMALQYDNECTAVVFDVERSYTRDRDYKGGTSFMIKVILKTLGGV